MNILLQTDVFQREAQEADIREYGEYRPNVTRREANMARVAGWPTLLTLVTHLVLVGLPSRTQSAEQAGKRLIGCLPGIQECLQDVCRDGSSSKDANVSVLRLRYRWETHEATLQQDRFKLVGDSRGRDAGTLPRLGLDHCVKFGDLVGLERKVEGVEIVRDLLSNRYVIVFAGHF